MAGQHGAGMIHLAWRDARGEQMKDAGVPLRAVRSLTSRPGASESKSTATRSHSSSALKANRCTSSAHPSALHFDEPFYVGIGFCSHLPATVDTAVLSNVVLENASGKAH